MAQKYLTTTIPEQEGSQFSDVGGEGIEETLFEILKHQSSLLDPTNNGGEIVIQEDNVSTLGAVGCPTSHGNTHICPSDGSSIVYTIPCLYVE